MAHFLIERYIMRRYFVVNIVIAVLFAFAYGCGDKKDEKTGNNNNNTSTDLIKKDSVSGKEMVQLKYVVKKGDKFN